MSQEQPSKELTSPNQQRSREQISPNQQRSKEQTPNPSAKSMDGVKKEDSSVPVVQEVAERAKELLTWTFKDVFDWNPRYFSQIRGVLNTVEVAFNMLIMSMIANACKNQPFVDTTSNGFYCRSADTFLFAVSISAFLNSLLLLFCCVLSKKSESRLWSTSYEVSYYIFYTALYFISAVNLTSNVVSRNKGKYQGEDLYNTTVAAGVFGILNFILYGASAVWFFVYHKKVGNKEGPDA